MFSRLRGIRLSTAREVLMVASFASAAVISVVTWIAGMRSGVRALNAMNR
jgi:hypothetical protein